jgi:hypothetical protein
MGNERGRAELRVTDVDVLVRCALRKAAVHVLRGVELVHPVERLVGGERDVPPVGRDRRLTAVVCGLLFAGADRDALRARVGLRSRRVVGEREAHDYRGRADHGG